MTNATLAKWLREELPKIEYEAQTADFYGANLGTVIPLLDALTALVALLREVNVCMTWANTSTRKRACQARLRAVLEREK